MAKISKEQELVEGFIKEKQIKRRRKLPIGVPRVKARVKIVGTSRFTPKRRRFTPGGLFDV